MDERDVLVVAGPGDVQDVVLSAAAAQEVAAAVVTAADEVAVRWRAAEAVFIAGDLAESVALRALPHRDGVFLVGEDPAVLALWSAPLGARVISLPEGAGWLGAVMTDPGQGGGRAPVVAVLGGSGGVGASTLAATLACLASVRSGASALVDTDLVGGGIDLLLGAEQAGGWRWPRLSGADGHVGDLRAYLPAVAGVSVVSMARGPAIDLAREPLAAIVGSLRRSHGLVVVDPGRGLTLAARESLRLATRVVLVVQGGVRGVAAAREVVRAHQLEEAALVVRRVRQGVAPAVVGEALDLPVVAELPADKVLASAAERGEPPTRAGRRYLAACRRLLAALLEDDHG
ncbi:MAG: septum site-determining protein Ssd [Propionicimonas sp.]|uniref:septum site-determining protein Ssd n=1 Tax=Propionicimonas sp. TaxID=1955623 RepID=UPI002B1EE943|nr:septum site-determining protein Ssd [Propionicimonas sp.]MEA4945807.1 septum site-determining protein Ssd [Propionicimonas sp.]MEA5054926.1 septum site-determining protein Ssd [Propionicimonas sp.]